MFLLANAVVYRPLSVYSTAVAKTRAAKKVAVCQRNTVAVFFNLFYYGVWGLYQTFVPEGVVFDKFSYLTVVDEMVVVFVRFGNQALPELVFVYGAGAGREKC